MQSSARSRLMHDFKKLQDDSLNESVTAAPKEDNIMEWEGGTFQLQMIFSEEYPNKAPKVKFITQMFHPNIYNDGQICLDILQNRWSPIYDISAILTSIQSLLCDPNPKSPANNEASKLYTEDRKEYVRRVKEIVKKSWEDDE